MIDFSSIRPDVTAEFAKIGTERGLRIIDAPVSGGEPGAKNATLSIMVGGSEDDFAAAKPILDTVGKTIVHVGANGAGQTVKAANQLIVAGNIELLAEAITFLQAYDVDIDAAVKVLGGGLAGSAVLDQKAPKMLARNFDPGFRIALHHKDLGIVTAAAREAGVVTPLGSLVAQLMASALANGEGGLDHSALAVGRRAAVGQGKRIGPMTRMRTVDAAVRILEIEGATQAFGLPGAAINPFYSAMRAHGGIKHVLARHVEAASHMAEGFTRAAAGNIGVCIGTSGPAGYRHDHRVVLRLSGFHSDTGDHRPGAGGQAPQGGLPSRRHRCDRRARHQDGDDSARTRTGPRRFRAGLPPDAVGPAGSGTHRSAHRCPAG